MNINYKGIFTWILSKWWIILLSAVAAAVMGGLIATFKSQNKFFAKSSIIVNISIIGDSKTASYTNEIMDTCVLLLNDENFLKSQLSQNNLLCEEKNCTKKHDKYTLEKLRENLNIKREGSSYIISILFGAEKEDIAFALTNSIAQNSEKQILNIYGNDSIKINLFSPTSVSQDLSNVSPLKYGLTGFLIGGILCLAVLFFIRYFDRRIYSDVDLISNYDLTVL